MKNDRYKNLRANLEAESFVIHPTDDSIGHTNYAFGSLSALAIMAVVDGNEWAISRIKELSEKQAAK
jgi:hypothetical protein